MEQLLTRKQVEQVVGLSRSSIYLMQSRGGFPRPIRVGKRAVRWRASDINNWIESRTRTFSLVPKTTNKLNDKDVI
jgi:prophage regulatory protein